jgi:hypothetical protein
MPILIILTVLVQAFFIYHVIRTRRPYWWAFVILSFPIAGSLIYYFVEVFPASREHRSARRVVKDIARAAKPDAELQRRAEEVAICGSMDNKLALAQECELAGMYGEAVKLYESCLSGLYANDPPLLFSLAHAYLMHGSPDKALVFVERLSAEHAEFKPQEVSLLLARVMEGRGQNARALELYETLLPVYTGLEAQYRYGCLLDSMGQARQAEGVFNGIVEHARRFNISHEEEMRWVKEAKRHLAGRT